jgi:hypothetical protein
LDAIEFLCLNEALDRLETEFPRRTTLVTLRYFAGFTLPEVAAL